MALPMLSHIMAITAMAHTAIPVMMTDKQVRTARLFINKEKNSTIYGREYAQAQGSFCD